ncbi:PREDICTED: uncharacterized protein LOC104704198 [Camelina sativa]|uniref:Uncharacterized protein LOC104704198 n=1 Tax=Camelina sativa TaxID=90675 RepID=A0ABM0T003_CAMSA|nr:PREDICTED: uncharacterized protein LOC104704198 [Camelina sativa]
MGPATETTRELTISHLISPVTLDWDKEKILQTLPSYLEQILEIKLSKLGGNDEFAWLPTNSGLYSAKSGYYESVTRNQDSSLQQDINRDFNWNSHIWKALVSPKIKFFMWKLMIGALPVGEQLRSRNINQEARCPFCGGIKTTNHLFFTCIFARQVWYLTPFKDPMDPDQFTTTRAHLESLHHSICLPPVGIGSGPLHPWVMWKIWTKRNSQVFKQKHATPGETLIQAITLAREWHVAQINSSDPQPIRTKQVFKPLESDVVLCKSDAAWDGTSKLAGLGCVFSNRRSNYHLVDSSKADHVRSPLMAEGLAALHALKHASRLGFTKITLTSDSTQLIEAIKSVTPQKELHMILQDILILSSSFFFCDFRYVYREENMEANALAKTSLMNSISVSI